MAPSNMNLRQAQVIDPILTTQARGYTNAQAIFPSLFPQADIPVRSMRVLRFGKEDFRLMSTRRAPGTSTKRITYGFESDPVALHQDALEATVPREMQEQAEAVPSVDLGAHAVRTVQNMVDLGHEKLTRDIAMNPASYAAGNTGALTGAGKWSNPDADTSSAVEDAKLTVAAKIGREPNVLVLGRDVFSALKRNQKIKDQFKYTGQESLTTAMLASYFEVENVIVGRAVYLPEDAPENTPANFIWAGAAILAYVNMDGTYLSPSFGYSYRLRGYPIVEQPYWETQSKSWVYGVTQERAPVATGADAGFLIETPL